MKTKVFLLTLLASLMFISQSCNKKLPCGNIDSDKEYYRASAVAYSTNRDLAYDKAIHLAKKNLLKQVSKNLVNKTGLDEQLIFDSLKKGIQLQELEIICKETKNKKGSYQCSLAIEMPASKFSKFHFD